jgi:hypothetical protein
MALFNFKTKPKTSINRAGGEAFVQDARMELASILLTSLAQDQFYRSSNTTFNEVVQLLHKVTPEFAAKAGIFARQEFGMRSITHVLAAELAAHISGKVWAKAFYDKIVKRPDDMLEIVAYYFKNGGKTIPNAMKKGFAQAFNRFDAYQLSKYRGERKSIKLVDLVNLVHPKPTERNAKALTDLINDELRATETWESKLTQAGQNKNSEDEKVIHKAIIWKSLLLENKLGYLALLRNLRNILEQAPDIEADVVRLLTNKVHIKKSMVLPFQYVSAFDAVNSSDLLNKRQVLAALSDAFEIALDNVPIFEGKTLVVVDDSGSMTNTFKSVTPIRIAANFAAVLYKSNDADLMRFSDQAGYLDVFHKDTAISISEHIVKNAVSGGTNFHAIFECANKRYDRIIILSDMQGWVNHYSPNEVFKAYKRKYNADPFVYSFDLAGYGTLQFPVPKVFALAGFSDKVFDLMRLLETDKNALIQRIESIDL